MGVEKKVCLHCGEILKGRVDKKFCDDYCRNTFNTQQNAITTNLIRNINHTLKRNRNLLSTFIPKGEEMAKVLRDKLVQEGFNFKYFTHIYETKKGSVYRYCYDFGYLELEGDWVLVVKGK